MPQVVHLAVPLCAVLVCDFVILALPLPLVWNLHMAIGRKIGVASTLSVGLFATAVDVVRIYYCFQTKNNGDIVWNNAGSLIWTAVEASLAMVCANIPSSAPLLKLRKSKETQATLDFCGRDMHSKAYSTLNAEDQIFNGNFTKRMSGDRMRLSEANEATEPYSC